MYGPDGKTAKDSMKAVGTALKTGGLLLSRLQRYRAI